MNEHELHVKNLFDLAHTPACAYLEMFTYPWEAVKGIAAFVRELSMTLGGDYFELAEGVYAHATARVSRSAELHGPAVIGAGSEVRQGAFVRGGVLVGENCVVGNSTELKNCILFDGVQVPHFNYVGDSVLGYKAHLGAGAVTSNVKSDRSEVTVKIGGLRLPTGLVKCGAFLGDGAEIGCNAVLCPGTVIGRRTSVYPLTLARGAYPADSIVKGATTLPRR